MNGHTQTEAVASATEELLNRRNWRVQTFACLSASLPISLSFEPDADRIENNFFSNSGWSGQPIVYHTSQCNVNRDRSAIWMVEWCQKSNLEKYTILMRLSFCRPFLGATNFSVKSKTKKPSHAEATRVPIRARNNLHYKCWISLHIHVTILTPASTLHLKTYSVCFWQLTILCLRLWRIVFFVLFGSVASARMSTPSQAWKALTDDKDNTNW
jgi:hypothetical protein